jgi:serine/threonine protein phosphatase PrpC
MAWQDLFKRLQKREQDDKEKETIPKQEEQSLEEQSGSEKPSVANSALLEETEGTREVESPWKPPAPLEAGNILKGEIYTYRIEEFLHTSGPANLYRATLTSSEKGEKVVLLKEALSSTEGQSPLEKEFRALRDASYPMFQATYEHFTNGGKAYLALEWVDGQKLSESLVEGDFLFVNTIPILIQVCQALRKLHNKGWVHLAVCPDKIVLKKPIKLVGLDHVTRAGEKPEEVFSIPGYSPPELLRGEPVDSRADIYSVGAILYRLITGESIPETGPELLLMAEKLKTPGVPQILFKCLGEKDTRFSHIDELLRMLLQLKEQLTPALRYTIAFKTSIGLNPSRTVNEDAFGFVEKTAIFESKLINYGFYCVADGMGGMEAGEVASRVAIETALQEALNKAFTVSPSISTDEQANLTKSIVVTANKAVYEESKKKAGSNMGTTFTCALIIGKNLTIGHVGDSRIYLIRGDEIRVLTEDHSLVTALLKSGQITPEEARKHPDRNKLFRFLGSSRDLPDYYVEGLEKVLGQKSLELKAGDMLLLCSDGFWGEIEDQEILARIKEGGSLQEISERLVQMANERGGMDNITVGLIRAVGTS